MQVHYSAFSAPDPATALHQSKHLLTSSRSRPWQGGDEPSLFVLDHVGLRYDVSPVQTRLQYGVPLVTRPLRIAPRPGDAAESINAEAMRRYRERWEADGVQRRGSGLPTLYPSRVQEMLERVK
jgi:hypothetical protein